MAIVNRDKDASEQITVFERVLASSASGISALLVNPSVNTGLTFVLMSVPGPAQLSAASVSAYGVSGSPVVSLWLYRFAGGFTSIAVGQSLAVTAYGTSGAQGMSLFGASWVLQAGDQLALYTQGSGAACEQICASVAIKALQDIRSSFGAVN